MQRNSFAAVRHLSSYQANNGHQILGRYKNYYDVLKVPANCSRSEIKRAYIELSKKYHPDGSSMSSNSDKFVKVCEAYKILYKRVSRDNYDTRLKSQFNTVPPIDFSFTTQNVHRSWKKYQATIRYKQFGRKLPRFQKPLVVRPKTLIPLLAVTPTTICDDESAVKEILNTFNETEDSSYLPMYFLTAFSIVGVLIAREFLYNRKQQSKNI